MPRTPSVSYVTWHGVWLARVALERAEADALRVERDGAGPARPAHFVDEPLLVSGQCIGHLFRQPLNRARREDVRRVALDELRDDAGPERIAVDVERRGAGAIFERLLVAFEAAAGVGAGHARRLMRAPLAGALEVGARDAAVALAAADVGAATVDGVEGGTEQLVAELESFDELLVRGQRVELALVGVHGCRAMDVGDVREVSDDCPGRTADQEDDGDQQEVGGTGSERA